MNTSLDTAAISDLTGAAFVDPNNTPGSDAGTLDASLAAEDAGTSGGSVLLGLAVIGAVGFGGRYLYRMAQGRRADGKDLKGMAEELQTSYDEMHDQAEKSEIKLDGMSTKIDLMMEKLFPTEEATQPA